MIYYFLLSQIDRIRSDRCAAVMCRTSRIRTTGPITEVNSVMATGSVMATSSVTATRSVTATSSVTVTKTDKVTKGIRHKTTDNSRVAGTARTTPKVGGTAVKIDKVGAATRARGDGRTSLTRGGIRETRVAGGPRKRSKVDRSETMA